VLYENNNHDAVRVKRKTSQRVMGSAQEQIKD